MNDHNHEAADYPIECAFCSAEAPSIEWAACNGWTTCYYDGDDQCDGPVCPGCIATRLRTADDGELELVPPITYPNQDIDREQARILAETRAAKGWA